MHAIDSDMELDGIVTPASDVFALGKTFSQLFWPSNNHFLRRGLDASLHRMRVAEKGQTNQVEQKVAQLVSEMIFDQPSDRIQSMNVVVKRLKQIREHLK